jgi:hypothetical protein
MNNLHSLHFTLRKNWLGTRSHIHSYNTHVLSHEFHAYACIHMYVHTHVRICNPFPVEISWSLVFKCANQPTYIHTFVHNHARVGVTCSFSFSRYISVSQCKSSCLDSFVCVGLLGRLNFKQDFLEKKYCPLVKYVKSCL